VIRNGCVSGKLPGVISLFPPRTDLLEANGQVLIPIFSPFKLRLRAQMFKLPQESEDFPLISIALRAKSG